MTTQRIVLRAVIRSAMVVSAFVLVVSPFAQEPPQMRPEVSGEWARNADLSTDLRAAAEGRRGGGPEGGPPGRGGGGGFGGGGRGGGGRGGFAGGLGGDRGGGDSEKMREQMQQARRLLDDAPASMVVVYSEPKLSMAAPDGRTRTLYTDRRKQKINNGNAEVQARWDDGRIVAETKFGSIKVAETFVLSSEGRQLVVTVKMDGGGGGRGGAGELQVRHVYDRVSSPSALDR